MDEDRPSASGSIFSGSNLIVSGGTYIIDNSRVYNADKGTKTSSGVLTKLS